MAHYLVEIAHTEAQCAQALDTIVRYGMHILDHTWSGCMDSVHSGWVNVEVDGPQEARIVVLPVMPSQARVVEMQTFTPEQARGFHA